MVSQKTEGRRAAGQRLISNARRMRHEPTDAERKFWLAVRGRQFGGYKFKRQYPVGSYIADFVCLDRKLIVELDGGQHAQQAGYDTERTAYLQAHGFRVLRVWNDDFLRTPDAILEGIWRALTAPSPVER
jgi:very-short-patch-repair endonuclease